MRHFVTLIEIHVHLIRVNRGHICYTRCSSSLDDVDVKDL